MIFELNNGIASCCLSTPLIEKFLFCSNSFIRNVTNEASFWSAEIIRIHPWRIISALRRISWERL